MSALEGASKYLNNLLLARGLLQNGKPIDFAHPVYGSENTDATMSKIINLVHDLVLRRDREADQQESMVASIRHLRAADSQRVLDLQQAQDKNQRLKNDVTTAQAHERAVRSSLKKMESHIKELKEHNLKMKSMLDQVRAKCTSDVRKRDVEIEKLKGHLIGIQRGKKGTVGMKINTLSLNAPDVGKERRTGQDISNTEWSLEKETNDFLAALVNETSAENVALRQVINDTLDILREMTGVQESAVSEEDDGIGIPGQYRISRRNHSESLVPVKSMAEQMNAILQHCKTILKDPSFVPIEEVQIRDEEIAKLRAGWERMADRWKEAITMMGQWKQRMTLEGKDTDDGAWSDLSFGQSVATRPDGQPVLASTNELSLVFEEDRVEEDDGTTDAAEELAHSEEESDLKLEPEPLFKRLASSPARRGVKLPRLMQPLGETDGNSGNCIAGHGLSLHAASFNVGSDAENEVLVEGLDPKLPKLTVAQKLAKVEAEAIEIEHYRQQGIGRKRKALPGNSIKSGRRRSTLSPEELAGMMEVK